MLYKHDIFFPNIKNLITNTNKESYYYKNLRVSQQNGLICDSYNRLLYLDEALNSLTEDDYDKNRAYRILNEPDSIEIRSNIVGEIVSLGLLKAVFPEAIKIRENNNYKTPDLRLLDDLFCEVYTPQDSQPEKEKVKKKLDSQQGPVKIAISHPLTGSNGAALKYPSNKIIDKYLSYKRESDQTVSNARNILWIDCCQDFILKTNDTTPLTTVNKDRQTFIGSFGVWHGLYGKKGASFLSDRSTLKHLPSRRKYEQQKNGLFRERASLTAVLILTIDGIVYFENPWSDKKLSSDEFVQLSKLFRLRIDYAWFDKDHSGSFLEKKVENQLENIEYLYNL
ncbi:MAG: hypothetical protein JXK07_00565 [Spirochaetes bacterium]|nr:hypothetical protein [Spirochaetota bacterium]MBN2772179.1 hypothetical protein [Spirochaetota bacterium]